MAYRVEVTRAVEAELEALYLWVTSRAPSQGAAWFNGLERSVLALDAHPERCPIAARHSMPAAKLTAKDRERFARVRAQGATRATDPSAGVMGKPTTEGRVPAALL